MPRFTAPGRGPAVFGQKTLGGVGPGKTQAVNCEVNVAYPELDGFSPSSEQL